MFRVLLTLGLFLLLIQPAQAIERPRLDVLGFSPDGRFFAYTQSGMDRGQVAFADLFVLDTVTDKWVEGLPIRVRYTPEQGDLTAARAALDAQSARLLRRLGLNRAVAGVTFVPRSKTEMSLDMPWGERVLMKLTPRTGLAAPGCPVSIPVDKGSLAGFHLTMQRPTSVTVAYSDGVIPRGRGCPLGYRFASGFIKPRGNDAVVANVIAYREATPTYGQYVVRYMAVLTVVKAPSR